jgi:DNA-directed RNA polymerase subunit RPC12/RpoP
MQLTLCPSCGYKIMTTEGMTEPESLKACRKIAKHHGFHQAAKRYNSCPKCGYSLQSTGEVPQMSPDEPQGQSELETIIDRINAGSIIIRSLRGATASLRKSADSFPTANPLLNEIAQAKSADIDINLQLKELAAVVEHLRERVNAFAGAIITASK